ncbi:MAG: A24 family peptidase [Gammaproteobacteria bacterium]|nr:A24 family peptidase [Gammaproteobacteria bacterium]
MDAFYLLFTEPAWFYTTVIILGLIVGSFLNVVIHRLPVMLKSQWSKDCKLFLAENGDLKLEQDVTREEPVFNMLRPRSRCPQCGTQIKAWENIPVISYLLLRGKCSRCSAPISIRYPIVEILSALMALVVAIHFGPGWQAVLAILLSWALICLSYIDYDHQYLPDNITLPFLWLGLLVNLNGLFTDIGSAVIGSMAGYLILWSIYKIFKTVTGKEGMGYGDFKLLAMAGAWLGWQVLPAIILMSSVVGALFGISMILFRRHDKSKPIPFGPYLAIATWIALLWGQQINNAYLNWIS